LTGIAAPDGTRLGYGFDALGRLIAVSYPGGASRGYLYEEPALLNALTGIVDERGVRVATLGYDASGRATATQHAGTQSFGVSYSQPADTVGSLIVGTTVDPSIFTANATVSDPLGTPRTYQWVGGDGHVYLTGANLVGGVSGFAARGIDTLPAYETDFAGVTTTFTWDTVRRLKTSTTEASGRPETRTTSTQWHPDFALPARVTEAGRVTDYAYDSLGNKLSETVTDTATGQSRMTRWTYAQGLATSMTDARGGVWKYGYDAAGNRTSETNPTGASTTYTYDGAGRVASRTDASGLLTTYTRDARGRVTSQTTGGETSSFAYTATGQLAVAVLPNGYQVTYAYDAADRLVAASDNRGASVTYTLDGAGNRVREEVKDANGNIALATGRAIDSLNRVSSVQGAQGQTTQFGYDANSEPVSTTDPLNQTTRQTLDALRRTTGTTFPDNASAAQSWNALDSVTDVTDPKGVKTQYQVNAFGEVTSETSPDIGTTNYQLDSGGSVVATTDARGATARILRDALGRPTEVDYGDQTQFFAYDAQGNVSRIDDGSGSTVYARDAQGRVLTKTQTVNDVPSSPSKYVVQYGYTNGDLTSIRYPSGLQVTYQRNLGRVTEVDVQAPGSKNSIKPVIPFATNIAYTALGQPKSWTWNNGDSASRTFDADGRMTANEFASYTWDAASRITGITQNLWVDTGTQVKTMPITWTVGYDKRNRITSMARDGQSTSFTYDANSNRLTKLEITTGDIDLENQFDGPGISLSTSETPKVDAGSNRLLGLTVTATATSGSQSSTSTSDVNYAVDAAGNMTSDGLRTFVYDGANRLSKVEAIQNGEAVGYEYLHNALGQRTFKSDALIEQPEGATKVTKSFVDWLQSALGWLFKSTGATKSRTGLAFVYDEQGNMLASYGNGSNTAAAEQMEFIWLPQENGTSIPIGAFKNGALYATHTDHLGTPRLITDSTKTTVWQWPYSSFGANKPTGVLQTVTAKSTKSGGTPAPQLKATAPTLQYMSRFMGQYCDAESVLCQNWWRLYRPQQGDFSQMDPAGLPAGLNRRIYVGGNSLTFTDRNGLQAQAAAALCGPGIAVCVCAITAATWMAMNSQSAGGQSKAPWAWIDDPLAGAEHDAYKSESCLQPPPDLGTCELLKWKLAKEEFLIGAMKAWDAQWQPGRHADAISQRERAAEKLRERIRNQCETCHP
jgi:RHS repeat-associated protein